METSNRQGQSMSDAKWVGPTIVGTIIATFLTPWAFIAAIYMGGEVGRLVAEHSIALIGIPWAGGCASVVVLMFRFHPGEVHVKLIGFELKGASAPALFWVICFLAIVFAIRMLW